MDPETLMLLLGSSAPPDPRLLDPVAALSGGAAPLAPLPIMPTPDLMPKPLPQAAVPPQEAYRSQPMPAPTEAYRSEPMGIPSAAAPTSLGAALDGGSTYQGNPWSRGGMADPNTAPKGAAASGDALLKSLRGVQMPTAPTPQKVSTPHAPTVTKMQGGALFDLLASLGIGPQQALPGLKLPSTLGQALGGR